MTKLKKLTARTPEDLLAAVPIILGFHPEDSVVMLTFGAAGGPPGAGDAFHARVDLPEPGRLGHAVDPDAFVAAGIEVVAFLRANGSRWFPVGAEADPVGRPYDAETHPFAAESVVEGAVIHRSRAELAGSLAGVPEEVARVQKLVPAALSRLAGRVGPAEARWVADTIREAVASERSLEPVEVARLVTGLTEPTLRDEAWMQITRAGSARQVTLWTDVLRRTPHELVPAPACLLAFSAWLSGQGALAWCALDRCQEVAPGFPMAEPIAMALDRAVPPRTWDDFMAPPSQASQSG